METKNTRIITLEGFPGSLTHILSSLQSPGVVIIPKASDTRGNDISSGIVSCARELLMTMKQIKKCYGYADTIIVPHYFDVPINRNHSDFQYARTFISRHLKQMKDAFDLEHVQFDHVHLRIPYEYIYELLLSSMSCRTLGTGDFSMYTKHLMYCPNTRVIDVPSGAFHTPSMKKEIIRKIFHM
jgi:hypothetical protein